MSWEKGGREGGMQLYITYDEWDGSPMYMNF